MFRSTRLSRLITMALASCAVTWAFAAGAFARPDVSTGTTTTTAAAPAFKDVAGDNDKGTSQAPAFKGIVVDVNKTPDRAAVDRNLASLKAHSGKNPGPSVTTGDDSTDTIALITAIAAMLVAIAAVTFIVVRPQRPVLRA